MGLLALYFDHKVAEECSTYHDLYMYAPLLDETETGALFKEKLSREKIKELETLLYTINQMKKASDKPSNYLKG